MKSLFFRLHSGQVFYFANLVTAKLCMDPAAHSAAAPAAPVVAVNSPPGVQAAATARLQLHFVGGHVETLTGQDAQAVWGYLAFISEEQLRTNAPLPAERQP